MVAATGVEVFIIENWGVGLPPEGGSIKKTTSRGLMALMCLSAPLGYLCYLQRYSARTRSRPLPH